MGHPHLISCQRFGESTFAATGCLVNSVLLWSLLVLAQETDFPSEMVESKDSDEQFHSVSVPVGRWCSRCLAGVHAAFPYFTCDELAETFETSAGAKAMAHSAVNSYHAGDLTSIPSNQSVSTNSGTRSILSVFYDGFERTEFEDAHGGCSPESLGVQMTPEVHPHTHQKLDLFFVPSKPHFQLQLQTIQGADHSTDESPSPAVYPEQAVHTYDFHKRHLKTSLDTSALFPPQSVLRKAMAVEIAKRGQRVPATPPPSGGSSTASNPFFPQETVKGLPKVPDFLGLLPRPPKAPSTPVRPTPQIQFSQAAAKVCALPGPSLFNRPTVKTEPGTVTVAVKSEPKSVSVMLTRVKRAADAAGLDAQSGSAQKRSHLSSSPLSPANPCHVSPVAPASTGKTSVPTQQLRKAPTPTATEASAPAATRSALAAFLGKDVGIMNLAQAAKAGPPLASLPAGKGSRAEDEESTASSEKDLGKYEKPLVATSLFKVLTAVTVPGDVPWSNLKRAMTMVGKDKIDPGAKDWEGKLKTHLDNMLLCHQLLLEKLMLHGKATEIVKICDKLKENKAYERLPKTTFCDICCTMAAAKCLPPFAPLDLGGLVRRLSLKGPLRSAYEISPDSNWLLGDGYLDKEDLCSGIVPARFTSFVATYIIIPFIVEGSKNSKLLVDFCLNKLRPMLDDLGPDYTSPHLEALTTRCNGLIFMMGEVPFLGGCSLKDVEFLKTDMKNIGSLGQTLQSTPWTASLFTQAYVHHAGEKAVWPQVEENVNAFKNMVQSDPASSFEDQVSAVNKILTSYPKWNKLVREDSLKKFIHGDLIAWCDKLIKDKIREADRAGQKLEDLNEADFTCVLEILKKMRVTGWKEVRIGELLHLLSPVSHKIQAAESTTVFVGKCATFSASELAKHQVDYMVSCADELKKVIPAKPSVVTITSIADRDCVLPVLSGFATALLKLWPTSEVTFSQTASMILDSVRFGSAAVGDDQGVETQCKLVFERLKLWNRLQAFQKHMATYKAAGHQTAEAIEKEGTFQQVKRMKVFETYFSKDMNEDFRKDINNSLLSELITESQQKSKEFDQLYVSNAKGPLMKYIVESESKAGCAPSGEKWVDKVSQTCGTWREFWTQCEGNIRNVNKMELLKSGKRVKDVHLSASFKQHNILSS